jgi:hypothetical protein
MKISAAVLSAAAACVLVGAPTTASASEGTANVPMVSVQGFGKVPIAAQANSEEANAAYRAGLTAAIADGLNKAEFLAHGTGATLGAIQAIEENGGSIECTNAEGGYVEYPGTQPDFGYTRDIVAPEVAGSTSSSASGTAKSTPVPKHKKKRKKKQKRAHSSAAARESATAGGCTLSAQLSLSYLLS